MTDAGDTGEPASASDPGDKTGDETRFKAVDGVRYEWKDITTEFIGACSSLELGELVHDSKYVAFDYVRFYHFFRKLNTAAKYTVDARLH